MISKQERIKDEEVGGKALEAALSRAAAQEKTKKGLDELLGENKTGAFLTMVPSFISLVLYAHPKFSLDTPGSLIQAWCRCQEG